MPTGHYRFRRSLGNVGSRFRGARPDTYPLYTGVLDSYPGAAAAYSLRALSRGWLAGDVVEVRPSSGWTPASFTASQVANGEMVDYVKRCGDFTNNAGNPYETFANNGTGDGFTATNSSGFGIAQSFSVSGTASDEVTIDFDIVIVSGSPSMHLRQNLAIVSTYELPVNGSNSVTLTATGSFNNFSFADGDVPSEFTVSNVRVSTNDGFVTTWYDQSGNANDATQIATASQPKIVDAGALVTGGLDFDGVDDSFGMSNLFSGTTAVAQFAVGNADTTGTAEAIIGQGSLSSPLGGAWHVTSEIAFRCAGNSIYDDDFIDANLLLLSTLVAASSTSADVEMFLDGVALGQTGTSSTALDFTTSSANIGVSSGGAYYDGRIAEIIVYDSDQTANRVGIETNINDHYSIYA